VFQDKFSASRFTVFEPDMQPNESTVEANNAACDQALFAIQIFKIEMSLKVACHCVSDQAHLVHVMTRVGFFSDAVAGFFKSLLHCAEVDSGELHIKPPEVCESRQWAKQVVHLHAGVELGRHLDMPKCGVFEASGLSVVRLHASPRRCEVRSPMVLLLSVEILR